MSAAFLTRETCDRCGPFVSAEFLVTLTNGDARLTLCGHCFTVNADALRRTDSIAVRLATL